jgi:hypothetical protein
VTSRSSTRKRHRVVIYGYQHEDYWEFTVEIDGRNVGSGTGPNEYVIVDGAADVLFGDKNDWINDSEGALGDRLRSESA